MMRNRFALAFALVALTALMVPAIAQANISIHGSYVQDTDACAGCHRAHTSVSSVTWSDPSNNEHSALLISSATSLEEFCYACHDATGQGADTNVEQGIYEGSLYGSQDATLNGGGFITLGTSYAPVTSKHVANGASWGAYGGGYYNGGQVNANGQIVGADLGESVPIKMDCATCHDPHGSPNYRLLKSTVNGNYVGGYTGAGTDPDPDGYVSSVETGWPVKGFRLHKAEPAYQPNYTTAMYAKGYTQSLATTANGATGLAANKGMSGWCSGCHSTYLNPVSTVTRGNGTTYSASISAISPLYDAADAVDGVRVGLALRHRHPINVELGTYDGPDKASMVITDSVLPLAHGMNERGTPNNRSSDWIECLTCHRAHGTSAVMSGLAADPAAYGLPTFPGDASALLRRDNRGVCEACHNK